LWFIAYYSGDQVTFSRFLVYFKREFSGLAKPSGEELKMKI